MKNNWQRKEAKDAKDFGAKTTKASGSTWFQPGDSKTKEYLFDSKYTDKKSYTITLDTWDKLYEEALFAMREPVLSLQIQDLELVVIPKEVFIKLQEYKTLLDVFEEFTKEVEEL